MVVEAKPGDHIHVGSVNFHTPFGKTHVFSATFDEVDPRSLLGKAGVSPGTHILSLDGVKITTMTPDEWMRAMSVTTPIRMELKSSDHGPQVIVITFPPHFWDWDKEKPAPKPTSPSPEVPEKS